MSYQVLLGNGPHITHAFGENLVSWSVCWKLWLVDWSSECRQSREKVHPWLKGPKELRLCRVPCVMSGTLELAMARPGYVGPLFPCTLTNYRMSILLWNLISGVATTLWILSLTQLAPILLQCKPPPAGLRKPTLLPMTSLMEHVSRALSSQSPMRISHWDIFWALIAYFFLLYIIFYFSKSHAWSLEPWYLESPSFHLREDWWLGLSVRATVMYRLNAFLLKEQLFIWPVSYSFHP